MKIELTRFVLVLVLIGTAGAYGRSETIGTLNLDLAEYGMHVRPDPMPKSVLQLLTAASATALIFLRDEK